MRIEVVGADTISQQARTYAEYRVFAALTRVADAETVQRARVVLRPVVRSRGCDSIACTVTVAVEGADSIRIRTTGPHAYAAINRAVERLRSRGSGSSSLFGRLSRTGQIVSSVDERNMRERLREIPDQPSRARIVFLAEETDIVPQGE